jgi:hypothetical protein
MQLEDQQPDAQGRVVLTGDTEVMCDIVHEGAREALGRLDDAHDGYRERSRSATRDALTLPRQPSMPAQERLRANEERPPGAPGQQAAECRQQQPVRRGELGPRDLPAQDRQLVSQHQDLQLLRALTASEQHDQLKQTADHDIHQRPQHARPPRGGRADAIPPEAEPPGSPHRRSNICTPHAAVLRTPWSRVVVRQRPSVGRPAPGRAFSGAASSGAGALQVGERLADRRATQGRGGRDCGRRRAGRRPGRPLPPARRNV